VVGQIDDANGRCRFKAVDALSRLVLAFHTEVRLGRVMSA